MWIWKSVAAILTKSREQRWDVKPSCESRGISLDRSCLSLSGSVHTFTFRGPLQRAVQRQLWLVAPPPPSRLSLTTLAPSLLQQHLLQNCKADRSSPTKMQSINEAPDPSCLSLQTLRFVTCNRFLQCTSLQVRFSWINWTPSQLYLVQLKSFPSMYLVKVSKVNWFTLVWGSIVSTDDAAHGSLCLGSTFSQAAALLSHVTVSQLWPPKCPGIFLTPKMHCVLCAPTQNYIALDIKISCPVKGKSGKYLDNENSVPLKWSNWSIIWTPYSKEMPNPHYCEC